MRNLDDLLYHLYFNDAEIETQRVHGWYINESANTQRKHESALKGSRAYMKGTQRGLSELQQNGHRRLCERDSLPLSQALKMGNTEKRMFGDRVPSRQGTAGGKTQRRGSV